jgi:hypothetical protein
VAVPCWNGHAGVCCSVYTFTENVLTLVPDDSVNLTADFVEIPQFTQPRLDFEMAFNHFDGVDVQG